MLKILQDPTIIPKMLKKHQKYIQNYILDERDAMRETKKMVKKEGPPEKYQLVYKQCQSWNRTMMKLQKQIGVK